MNVWLSEYSVHLKNLRSYNGSSGCVYSDRPSKRATGVIIHMYVDSRKMST